MITRALALSVSIALMTAGCSSERPATADATGPTSDAAIQSADATDAAADAGPDVPVLATQAKELGLMDYVDSLPDPSVESTDGDTTTYRYEPGTGPICMHGKPFRFGVRDLGSNDLVIFLQGGGACWSDFCCAVNAAPPGIPAVDALNRDLADNPFKDWNVVYLPYCDGSLFIGDADHDDDGDGKPDRFQHGIQNLSGALRVAHERFAAPHRILLTGSSAGGYGTFPATLMVRALWPTADLYVFEDSGVGLAKPDDPSFIKKILDEFNASRFIPPSCTDCLAHGHITPMVAWALARDPKLHVAVFSSTYDSIIGHVFLKLTPTAFHTMLMAQTDPIHQAYPDRYKRFIVDGVTHTALLGDPTGIIGDDPSSVELPPDATTLLADLDIGSLDGTQIDGVTMAKWLAAFVNQTPAWKDAVQPAGTPPNWN